MRIFRKVMTALLCVALLLSCTVVVHAEGEKTYCAFGHTSHAGITCDAELITWEPWTGTTLPTTGSYYLTDDVTITATCKPSNLNLDLNGCNVTRLIEVGDTDDCNVFSVVSEKTFLLTDTNAERHGIVSVTWEEGAESANAKKLGKVVKISANAIMKMYGGIIDGSNISGNTNTNANAAVNVENGTNKNDAELHIYGGKIIGIQNYKTSSSGTKTYYDGSAIITRSGTTLRIYGGEIVGGTCKRGACLYANSDDTKIYGGTFVGGTVSSAAAGIYVLAKKITIGNIVSDGGIYISDKASYVTLVDAPQIGGTCSSGYGIGFGASSTGVIDATGLSADARINIKNNREDLTAPIMKVDEDLSDCFTFWNDNYRAQYNAEEQTLSMEPYTAIERAVCYCKECKGEIIPQWKVWDGTMAAGHYYLEADTQMTATGTFAPAQEATMVLNLNSATLRKSDAGRMFLLQGKANLVLMDGSVDASGAFIGNSDGGNGMIVSVESADASAEIYGGNFSLSNPDVKAGKGALLYAGAGSLKIAGGTYQAASAQQGDAVYAASGSKLSIGGDAQFDGGVEVAESVDFAISGTPVVRNTGKSAYALKTASTFTVGELTVGARIFVTGTQERLLASEFENTNAFDAKFYFSADSTNMRIKEVDGAVKLVPMVIDAAVTQARRDQVEAYMRAQATLLWKATEDITYCFSRTTDDPSTASSSQLIKIKAGRTYMGVPYAYSMTTPTSFLDYAGEPDANNIYPISGLGYKPMSGLSSQTRMGNDCSSAVASAWAQVGATVYGTTSAGYVPRYGIVNVGDYIPEESYGDTGTAVVTQKNGTEVMYESYAQLQKADALVRYKSANNHTMMVVSVNVVRNTDGTINPTSSYAIVLEQTSSNVRNERTKTVDGIGTVYEIYGVDKKYTFDYLYRNTYIPVTCMELLDAAPVDAPEVKDDIEVATADNLFEGTITSNKLIDCVTITVTDQDGKAVQKAAQNAYRSRPREFIMSEFITGQPKEWSRGIVDLSKLTDGEYRCEVVCRLATGEEFTVRDFNFTVGEPQTGIPGDMNGDGEKSTEDAVYLLLHIMFGATDYPIATGIRLDLDGSSAVDTNDAVYLLLHVMFGATDYPLTA